MPVFYFQETASSLHQCCPNSSRATVLATRHPVLCLPSTLDKQHGSSDWRIWKEQPWQKWPSPSLSLGWAPPSPRLSPDHLSLDLESCALGQHCPFPGDMRSLSLLLRVRIRNPICCSCDLIPHILFILKGML